CSLGLCPDQRLRTRGSMAAIPTSTSRFITVKIRPAATVKPTTTGWSRSSAESIANRPIPGQANTYSTTAVPTIRLANTSPSTVITGTTTFGKTCLRVTGRAAKPLAWATVTYSCVSTSSTAERVSRVSTATGVYERNERPKSPCSAPPNQWTYCSTSGSSMCSSARLASTASRGGLCMPLASSSTTAGSPGVSAYRPNETTETTNSTDRAP